MYLIHSLPLYLSPFAKCLEGVLHQLVSFVVPGPSQWFFHFSEEIVIAWTEEKTTTFGNTETHHSLWQCKKSHRCCHGPLAVLTMGDSGTSTVLTRYESMRLRSLHQSERTTARDPVQHKRWTYPCYRVVQYGTSAKMDAQMVYDAFQTFVVVVVILGFMMLSTSQVISITFYSEWEKSDKFCSEALILAWGSFTCRKSTTRDPQLYFPSEGSHTLKKSIDPGRDRTREPRIQRRIW